MTNEQHAARLEQRAQEEHDMSVQFSPIHSADFIATSKADAAALRAGTAALRAVEGAKAALSEMRDITQGGVGRIPHLVRAALAELEGK